MSMPFYVSPEQIMRDKADYARKGIARGRSCVALQYAGGILMVAPNPSTALHKISESTTGSGSPPSAGTTSTNLRRTPGVTYADITGYQFDRHDVTARGIANWYAQTLGSRSSPTATSRSRWRSSSPRWGSRPRRATRSTGAAFDGRVTDEQGFVAFGGQAEQVSASLKEHYTENMTLAEAFAAALAALSAPGNGERNDIANTQLEVAILDRARDHRAFRRIRCRPPGRPDRRGSFADRRRVRRRRDQRPGGRQRHREPGRRRPFRSGFLSRRRPGLSGVSRNEHLVPAPASGMSARAGKVIERAASVCGGGAGFGEDHGGPRARDASARSACRAGRDLSPARLGESSRGRVPVPGDGSGSWSRVGDRRQLQRGPAAGVAASRHGGLA